MTGLRNPLLAIVVAAALAVAAGCNAHPQPVRLEVVGVRPTCDTSELAKVLAACVTGEGRLKRDQVGPVRASLQSYLKAMAVAGPATTPDLFDSDQARWAYWYNCRAAWSIELAALAGLSEKLEAGWMHDRPFPLDGRMTTLAQIDALLLQEAEQARDFRLAACAPGVSVNDAPLPLVPWLANDFPQRLEEALDKLVRNEQRFQIDIDNRAIRFPPGLWAARELLCRQYRREFGECDISYDAALAARLRPAARLRLENALGYQVLPQRPRPELAVTKRSIYYPGKVGKVELE
jgi:hypothetical protein